MTRVPEWGHGGRANEMASGGGPSGAASSRY